MRRGHTEAAEPAAEDADVGALLVDCHFAFESTLVLGTHGDQHSRICSNYVQFTSKAVDLPRSADDRSRHRCLVHAVGKHDSLSEMRLVPAPLWLNSLARSERSLIDFDT